MSPFGIVAAVFLLLGVLIVVHELGHFVFAKLFDVKVLRFSLGFGRRIVGITWGETEYRLSWVLLGGYVRLLGEDPGEPWSRVDWDADPDWDFHSAADDEPEQLLALYTDAIECSRQAIEGCDDLSATAESRGRVISLRWMLVHMIEEYARHCGHADLIRQSIDGATGD